MNIFFSQNCEQNFLGRLNFDKTHIRKQGKQGQLPVFRNKIVADSIFYGRCNKPGSP